MDGGRGSMEGLKDIVLACFDDGIHRLLDSIQLVWTRMVVARGEDDASCGRKHLEAQGDELTLVESWSVRNWLRV